LTTSEGTAEITAEPDRPIAHELLLALRGESRLFSTANSLALAELLLHARDAADHGQSVAIPSTDPHVSPSRMNSIEPDGLAVRSSRSGRGQMRPHL
jgi:hypothetical protein